MASTAVPLPAITVLDGPTATRHLDGLATLLHACVLEGASIGFVLPLTMAKARAFWEDKVLPGVSSGARRLLAIVDEDQVIGSVQLGLDTPANGRHRAEVNKLLVHPDHRRRGLGRALMAAAEAEARAAGRRLLVLDTRTGDHAEPLYQALGYQIVGIIPDYCIDARTGHPDATTVMFKPLALARD